MRGYVQYSGSSSKFTAQRSWPSGKKVDFEQLHLTFAKNSGFNKLEPGFIGWLKENIFKTSDWSFHNVDGSVLEYSPLVEEEEFVTKKKAATRKKNTRKKKSTLKVEKEPTSVVRKDARGAGRKMVRKGVTPAKGFVITPTNIIEADYTEAKVLIETCSDVRVL